MTLIIAEAGVNHNGSKELAMRLIEKAHEAGADIVKFQTFKAGNIASLAAPQASYQTKNTKIKETQLDMLSRLELPFEAYHELTEHCNTLGIEFLSTAFDFESLDFLVNQLHLETLKIPSGEITNAPLVLEHARTGCNLIVSTGMSTLSEIENTLGVIAFGYTTSIDTPPSESAFQKAYSSREGQALLKSKVTLLHCTTEYPAPINEINLMAMDTLHLAFDLPAGYSDHSEGVVVPIAAVARGAVIIEKHFTLDKQMKGPDHKASLDPDELKNMVDAIRQVETALGHKVKYPTCSEIENKSVARKSLVAARTITKGDALTKDNLAIKRPGDGMSPYAFWELLNKPASRDYSPGDLISE